MITERDIEIFKFINRYGKSYIEVLGKTFFGTEQGARNRINILKKQNLISYWNTNLMTPRRAIVLSDEIKNYLEDELDIKPKNAKLNTSTIEHNIIEQLSDFYLSKLENSNVERTTVYTHSKNLNHVPDLILNHEKGKIYIEVETSKKNPKRYIEIFKSMQKDNVLQVIYVVKNETTLSSYAATFPSWKKLRFITINKLIENIKSENRMNAMSQADIVKLG